MREEEVFVAIAFFISAAVTVKVIASTWLRHWENKLKYGAQASHVDPQLAARMERIEQALDSIAIEVERISENQRFTTRLLSEREGAAQRISS
jgi:hypothetical protein